jgi:hypothetical protein
VGSKTRDAGSSNNYIIGSARLLAIKFLAGVAPFHWLTRLRSVQSSCIRNYDTSTTVGVT